MGLLYRPGHPRANENGMVPREWLDDVRPDAHLYVISDTMAPAFHHAALKTFDSKSEFRKATRAHGCVEVGTERVKPRAPVRLDKRARVEAIRRSIQELRNR